MAAKLRVADFDGLTGTVRGGVQCGISSCHQEFGDLEVVDGTRYASLIEGFRREMDGCYRLHSHAKKRLKRGKDAKDTHPRWHRVRADGTMGPGSDLKPVALTTKNGTWEVLRSDGSTVPLPANVRSDSAGPPPFPLARERITTRECVALETLRITCPNCRFSNTVHGGD